METSKQTRIENVLDMFAPLVDFTLIAGLDQEKVPVVRKLLTQKSVYFEKLLGPSFREGAQQEVTLQDIDGPSLMAIIAFIYSGGIDLTEENVGNILDGASQLELVTLEKLCESFMQKNLSKENCFQMFLLADKHCFDALRADAAELVGAHFEIIPKSDVLLLDGRVLGEIVKCDKIQISETSLFDLLVEWVEQNEIVHSPFMPNLLESIRMEHLPGEFILNVAEPIFNRYGFNELVSAEYRRRMLIHQISPRRWYEEVMGDSVFHAEIIDNKSIDIYKCYPNSKQIASIPFHTSCIDQGWAFHDGKFYRMGGYHSADGGRTSDEVEVIDMDTKECTKLPNMLNARSGFKPLVCGKYIYVFGGKNKNGFIYDCERFDTQSNQWEALPKMISFFRNCIAIELNGNFVIVGEVVHPLKRILYLSWCNYFPKTKIWSTCKRYMINKKENVAVFKSSNHAFSIIVDSTKIYRIDTQNDKYSGDGSVSLSDITIGRILECAGSPYILYRCSSKNKFGRIVFNGDECHIVDSVEISKHFATGFLFRH